MRRSLFFFFVGRGKLRAEAQLYYPKKTTNVEALQKHKRKCGNPPSKLHKRFMNKKQPGVKNQAERAKNRFRVKDV